MRLVTPTSVETGRRMKFRGIYFTLDGNKPISAMLNNIFTFFMENCLDILDISKLKYDLVISHSSMKTSKTMEPL